jgi:elongation factor 1-beta
MGFGDLSSDAGLKALNAFCGENSYMEGYVPSQADVAVFDALKKSPCKDKCSHAARWYAHIASFEAAGRKQFPQSQKPAASYVSGGPAPAAAADDDDDVDLFGSDEEEEESAEAAKVRQERLDAYAAKKSKKPALIAKTSVLLDVKPWGDETDMEEVCKMVKEIQMDGLVWGAHKLVAIGYGIKKLQVLCIVEDLKVSIDELQEKIQDFEEHVQSTDVAAMNKI